MNEAGQMQAFRHLATSVSLAALLFCAVGTAQAQPAPAPAVPAPAVAPTQDNPATDTVDAIRARGRLLCGVSPSTPGFAAQEGRGGWRGMDVEYCRAVASAILGDPAKVQFVPVPAADRFEMLRHGSVDILARNTTWTLDRDTAEGALFVGVTYSDGQGFLVRRDRGVTRVQQLDGATVCVEAGTTSERHLLDHARSARLRITAVAARSADAARAAFVGQQCDALTGDTASLAGFMAQQGSNGSRYAILFEVISKEPLGPAVRENDKRLLRIARWTHFVMLAGEELGLDSAAVTELQRGAAQNLVNANQEVQALFGRAGRSGEVLGLDSDWGARVLRQVGNYREVWERNIGPLGVQRGLNLLWNQGGLQYAPPLR
jgi:general L-amino acid transport system substrate-binding protein